MNDWALRRFLPIAVSAMLALAPLAAALASRARAQETATQAAALDDLPTCPKEGDPPTYVAGHLLKCLPGNLNGTKVMIPNYYFESYPEYDGRNWLSVTPLNTHPTFANAITNFNMRLRGSNLRPIVTDQDLKDFFEAGRKFNPHYEDEWISIDIQSNKYPKSGDLSDRREFELSQNWYGPFSEPITIHGLSYYNSLRNTNYNLGSDVSRMGQHYDVYVDNKCISQVIACIRSRTRIEPYIYFKTCHHYFLMPDMKLLIDIYYADGSIQRWREIQDGVEKIIRSFVVQ